MDIVENQAAVVLGALFGAILCARVLAWIALLIAVAKQPQPPLLAAVLHSGPFALVAAALMTYFAATHLNETPAAWFLGGLWAAPMAVVALAIYARRAHQGGPLLWVFAQRRNLFIFGYVTMAFVVSPYVWALRNDVTLAVLVVVVAIAGSHFLYWYMWQLVGPEIERVAALRRAEGVHGRTDTAA